MHGVLGIWRMDPARRAEQVEGLHAMIIPMVRRQPGFVAGYWTYDAAEHRSYSLTFFDTAENASEFKKLPERDTERARAVGIERELITLVSVDGYDVADPAALAR
jgi:hypothetical protein